MWGKRPRSNSGATVRNARLPRSVSTDWTAFPALAIRRRSNDVCLDRWAAADPRSSITCSGVLRLVGAKFRWPHSCLHSRSATLGVLRQEQLLSHRIPSLFETFISDIRINVPSSSVPIFSDPNRTEPRSSGRIHQSPNTGRAQTRRPTPTSTASVRADPSISRRLENSGTLCLPARPKSPRDEMSR